MTEIKVGDTVRILPSAPRASTAHMGVGKEFVVTQLQSTSVHEGATPNFALGEEDFARMGVFLRDLEKVEADLRWRYNDHIVVYPETRDANGPGRGVTVLDETPLPKIYTRWENRPETEGDEITAAARAYWEAHEPNPVIKEAKVRGDYAYFAYQLRYNDSAVWLEKYTKADIDAALPVIDRLALNASGE